MANEPGSTSRLLNGKWRDPEHWIQVGQDLLRDEGFHALRVAKLSKRLNVTSGSFYYHFKNLDSYLERLAEAYASDIDSLIRLSSGKTDDPLERLRILGRRSARADIWRLSTAMTVWAVSDGRAAKSLEQGEDLMINFLGDIFRAFGFDDHASMLRGKMLVSLNLSHTVGSKALRDRDYRRSALELLLEHKNP